MKILLKKILSIIISLLILCFVLILLFFKTDLFAKYRDIWVQTAMETSSHQWLAELFLSDSEISKIMEKYEVSNNTNSNSDLISISDGKQNITIENISGGTYKGYVVIVENPDIIKIVNTVDNGSGTVLGDVVDEYNAIVGINAGGFETARNRKGSSIVEAPMIIDEQLLYGSEDEEYSFVGFSSSGKLILGNYTYEEAIANGIVNAVSFAPFLIVNGVNQVSSSISGGYQPRTAIGQRQDGTLIIVVIEGRKTSSLGATYYDLQEIMQEYGAYNAANLDGGNSSTLYYDGLLINDLSGKSEREIPNAILIM